MKFKSFLKLVKIFPRFPSFRICPNAKYENSEISLTLLFCSKTVQETMKTVTAVASHRHKIQVIPEGVENLSEISEFSDLP